MKGAYLKDKLYFVVLCKVILIDEQTKSCQVKQNIVPLLLNLNHDLTSKSNKTLGYIKNGKYQR